MIQAECDQKEFFVGQELYWVHGEHHRMAKVVDIDEDNLTLEGVSLTRYKCGKASMRLKLDRTYPVGTGL